MPVALYGADPDPISWAWTGLAVVAAARAFVVARGLPPADRSGRAFWWSVAVVVLLLAVNKELDLHSVLLRQGHDVFATHGWLGFREDTLLVLACVVAVAGAGAAALLVEAGAVGRFPVAAAGLVLLLGLLVVATIQLTRFSPAVQGSWLPSVLEFSGVAAILLGSIRVRTRDRRSVRRSSS